MHMPPIQVTECEIFLSVLVKFLESEKPMWQRCLALEVLYRVVLQPELIKLVNHSSLIGTVLFVNFA